MITVKIWHMRDAGRQAELREDVFEVITGVCEIDKTKINFLPAHEMQWWGPKELIIVEISGALPRDGRNLDIVRWRLENTLIHVIRRGWPATWVKCFASLGSLATE
ncbi:hypothetical protein HY415_01090 [Candidatus Kaiserbacteria bacterium]|nr:hypothetical protein [Candidatus Kaiserbacteria bacterium]